MQGNTPLTEFVATSTAEKILTACDDLRTQNTTAVLSPLPQGEGKGEGGPTYDSTRPPLDGLWIRHTPRLPSVPATRLEPGIWLALAVACLLTIVLAFLYPFVR